MDIEFHYYVNFLIALASGFSKEFAYTIAYSAQLLDDNTAEYSLTLPDGKAYQNQISQSLNIFLPIKKLYRIYQTFHFLPGDNAKLPLVTTPNSTQAKLMIMKALLSNNHYLIGIASHSFCDTWAHQNFTGSFDNYNASTGLFESIIPNIGHADFGKRPDIMSLIWYDSRFNQKINNSLRFTEAAKHLFEAYQNFLFTKHVMKPVGWGDVEKMLIYSFGTSTDCLLEAMMNKADRIKKYHEVCMEEFMVDLIDYQPNKWLEEINLGHWVAFQQGVKYYLTTS